MPNLREMMKLPYNKNEGPLPLEQITSELIDVTNCQRYMQLRFSQLGILIPPEQALSLEAFDGLGTPVIIASHSQSLSIEEVVTKAKNLDIVFADRKKKNASNYPPRGTNNAEWKKQLHIGLYADGHIDHSHKLKGSAEIEELTSFIRRYHIVGLRRIPIMPDALVQYNEFISSYLQENY